MLKWWKGLRWWGKMGVGLGAFVLVGVLAGGGDDEPEVVATTGSTAAPEESNQPGELDELRDQLEAAEAALADVEDQLASTESQVSQVETERQQLLSERDEALAELAAALERAQALELAFDAEIAAARQLFAGGVTAFVCSHQEQNPASRVDVQATVATYLAEHPDQLAALAGYDMETLVSLDQLETERNRCYDEFHQQYLLTRSKGDGFYTVGVEIAPGTWRSDGSGSGCYWARLDRNQEILANHFGSAGGSVTIRASDYEVEFSDCGTWEYQG